MSKPIILFATLSEFGQANCHMATIASLQEHHGDDVEIHLTSQAVLKKRTPPGVTFHTLPGKSLVEYWASPSDPARTIHNPMDIMFFAAGFFGSITSVIKLTTVAYPEPPEEYVATAKGAVDLLNSLKPDLLVVDNFNAAVIDAANKTGQKYIQLSPNTLKDVASQAQGMGMFLLPFMGTGYPFPMPWYLVPLNIINALFLPLWLLFFDSSFKAKNKARNAAGFPGPLPLLVKRSVPTMCMSTPSIDFPGVVPPDAFPCGPILQASQALQDIDAELYGWVMRRPTVLICLGTHYALDEAYGNEMLRAIRLLLDTREDVQVLWKLKRWKTYALDTEYAGDRLRVAEWLAADPVSIMATGNVVCSVNHGGSNSYHEALSTGTPQVIVSSWYDCHDFAVRAEWLGIGKWGNKAASPLATYGEVYRAILQVIGVKPDAVNARKIRQRAKEISEVANGRRTATGTKYGPIIGPLEDVQGKEGRDVAAGIIMDYLAALKKI